MSGRICSVGESRESSRSLQTERWDPARLLVLVFLSPRSPRVSHPPLPGSQTPSPPLCPHSPFPPMALSMVALSHQCGFNG